MHSAYTSSNIISSNTSNDSLPQQQQPRPAKKQALAYRHSQSWSTASSDFKSVSSPPAQHPPLPTRTPPLLSAHFVGFNQQPRQQQQQQPSLQHQPSFTSASAMYSQQPPPTQEEQQAYQSRPNIQRTPSQNATLTLGSFAPLPVASPGAASSLSGRTAYHTPLTSPAYALDRTGYPPPIEPGLAAPITLAPPAAYAGTGVQPSFGSMMGIQTQQQSYESSSNSSGYYPPTTDAAMYSQQPTSGGYGMGMGASPLSATTVGGTALSRNPSTAYAGSSLLNSPPPGMLSNSGASPPPTGFSSSTMMHDPSSSLHSRTGSQQALQHLQHQQQQQQQQQQQHQRQNSANILAAQQQLQNGGRTTPGLGGKGGLLGPSNSGNRLNKHLIPSKNSGIFMAVILMEAVAVTTMVVIVFALIEARIKIKVQYLKTVPVYLSIFVLGMVFEFIVALDAVRLKNTIQVVGVAIFNVALTVTAALEITQVRDALQRQDLDFGGIPCDGNRQKLCSAVDTLYYPSVQRYLIVVPILTGLAQIPITVMAYYLFKDFGWAIYRKIGADLRIRNMFMWYQVFVVWLKFDFFFGGAFTIAYLIIVANKDDWEYPLTIAAVPAAFFFLLLAAFAVRREVKFLMWICIGGFVAGIVYFLYKLASIFVSSTADEYTTVRLTLPFFSIFATVSLMFTTINACICLYNFGKGLREAHDSFGTFGGLWNNSRKRRGGGLRDSLGNRLDRSNSSANQLNRFGAGAGAAGADGVVGGGFSEGGMGERKMSLNTSLDSSTGMKRVMMGGNGLGGGGPGGAVGVIGEDDGMFEMTPGTGTMPPRRPRISID
ncbi:unnamed protein product [Tilletia controversa]|uniref:Uncharacterized protein n=3 Tax=Tilletia TaxID=13289 RepID=A0A8X7N200_9BASI|nr:hypothetical protein CF336_g5615 [Tilletia laevis]KAE8205890.1 hypothetical protein CF328_g228 [Tilletia controversa]CAD6892544.1 unnamed protein product [Tilletia caries]KAE8194620.1 hypothetical protein CF335_g5301 [Tilletia laevis]KAE8256011.1 hypothetical protein A4X06_0g132 [Tilletia controversa]